MKSAFSFAVAILLTSTSMAQERTAAGAMDTQMTWTALSARVDSANTKADAINARINQGVVCATKGMLYAPGTAGVDGQGCKKVAMPDPATLNVNTYTQAICARGGGHSVVSTCPAGQRLLGCGGGPGDQFEDREYWVLMPDFKNNRCIGYVGEPACFDGGWSRTIVAATCYAP